MYNILENKHHYMQVLSNSDILRKTIELKSLDETSSDNQFAEVDSIWTNAFIGLIREGLVYDYIKKESASDIVRLTINNVQYDCEADLLKSILQDEYDNIIKPEEHIVEIEVNENVTNQSEKSSNEKSEKEIALERELEALKERSEEETKRLKYESTHDVMTGLKNKRAFVEYCKELSEVSETITVLSIDTDNLKEINDNFGHSAGDKMLKSLAELLVKHFKHQTYRIGGDEFIVLTSMDYDSAYEQVSVLIDEFTSLAEQNIKYSFSFGFVSGLSNNVNELVEDADKKMYEYKNNRKKSSKNLGKIEKEQDNNIREVVDNINNTTNDIPTPHIEMEDITNSNLNIQNITIEEDTTIYNDKFEKMKNATSFMYDIYDLTLLPPGGYKGDGIKAIVAPLYINANDTHPDIMAMLVDERGRIVKGASTKERSSVTLEFNENEFIIRGTFANGVFKSHVMLAGNTLSMGYNLNKNVISKRPENKNNIHYGHIVFEEAGFRFHIVPTSLQNDDNGIARCLICIEQGDARTVINTVEKGFTVFEDANHNKYQILTYWQNDFLCAEVLNA